MATFKNRIELDTKDAKQSMDNLGTSVKDLDRKIKDNTKTTREAVKEQRELERETRKMAKAADNAKGSIVNMVGALKSGNFQNIGRDLTSLGKAMKSLGGGGEAFKAIASNVGASVKQFASLAAAAWPVAAAIGAAFAAKALFDFNVELEKTTARVKEITGLSDDMAETLGNGIKGITDAWGGEFDEVLHATDTLMASFGMTSDEALQLVRDGLVIGANDAGNFYSMIGQFSGAFKDAGLSAEEMVTIMSQAKGGLFTEDMMSSVVKGTANIRNMSKTTSEALSKMGIDTKRMQQEIASGQMTSFQALQQVTEQVTKLGGNSQLAGEVMKDLFGKQGVAAGTDMAQAISELNTEMEKAKEQADEHHKAVDGLAVASTNFRQSLSDLFGVSGAGFRDMGTNMKTNVLNTLTQLIDKVIDAYNNTRLLRIAWHGLVGAVKVAVIVQTGVMKALGTAIWDIVKALDAVTRLEWKEAANHIKKLGTDIDAIIKESSKKIADVAVEEVAKIDDKIEKKNTRTTEDIERQNREATERAQKVAQGVGGGTSGGGSKGSGGRTTSRGGGGKTEEKIDAPDLSKLKTELENEFLDLGAGDAEGRVKAILNKLLPEYFKAITNSTKAKTEKGKQGYIDLAAKIDKEIQGLLGKEDANAIEAVIDYKLELGDSSAQAKAEIEMLQESLQRQFKDTEWDINISPNIDFDEGNNFDPTILAEAMEKLKDVKKPQLYDVNAEVERRQLLGDRQTKGEIYAQVTDENLERLEEYFEKLRELGEEYENLMQNSEEFKQAHLELMETFIDSSFENQINIAKDYKDAQETMKQQNYELASSFSTVGAGVSDVAKTWSEFAETLSDDEATLGEKFASFTEGLSGTVEQFMNLSEAIQKIIEVQKAASEAAKIAEAAETAASGAKTTSKASEAMVDATGTVAKAANSGAGLPFPANIAAIAAGVSAGLSVVSVIVSLLAKRKRYASGGIVQGASSVGDYNLVGLNSGEMVLNQQSQNSLWRFIQNPTQKNGNVAVGGQVTFKIRGQELVGVLNNYNTKTSKI